MSLEVRIEQNVPLAPLSTLGVGGSAELFVTVRTKEELREAILYAQKENKEWRVIGRGSNIVFTDEVLEGLTIQNSIEGLTITHEEEGTSVCCGAGLLLDDVVRTLCKRGIWGLENLSHIPGTVGATPVQNVGAYGVEIRDILKSVVVYDSASDAFRTLTNADCQFEYRHSLFKEAEGKKYSICEVTFLLSQTEARITYRDVQDYFKSTPHALLTPMMVREAVIAIRSKKFPDWHVYGTAGSFFKNPIITDALFQELQKTYPAIQGYGAGAGYVKVPLGWILDHVCNMRGVREGNVGTYAAQALVVVRYGNATAADIFSFTEKIRSHVKEKTGITIEYEVTYITNKK